MKKLIAIFLILLLILSFAACATPSEPSGDAGDTDTAPSNTESTNNGGATPSSAGGSGGTIQREELPTTVISTYEEYVEKVQSPMMFRIDFVSYEDVADLGTFQAFQFSNTSYQKLSYFYLFEDNVALYVFHAPQEFLTNQTLSTKSSDDMRTYDSNVSGSYFIEDIEYQYQQGKISNIIWQSEGITFFLDCNILNGDVYDGENTVMTQLLDRNTAMQVKAAFDTMIEEKLASIPPVIVD